MLLSGLYPLDVRSIFGLTGELYIVHCLITIHNFWELLQHLMTFGENAVSLGDGADCVIKGCYLMKLSLNSISNRLYGENFPLRKEKAKVTLIKQ